MPSTEPNRKLIDLFNSLENANTVKLKSDLLTDAKRYILNEMSDLEIRQFFITNEPNFENLFTLNIWTKSLDENNGIVEFLEPYDIIDKIFNCFNLLQDFLNHFKNQTIFLLNQDKDEKVKHMCVENFIRLSKHLNLTGYENLTIAKDDLEIKIKHLLNYFIRQIPNTTVHYTQLLSDLFCILSIRLIEIEKIIQENEQRVFVFSCTIFENNLELFNEFEKVAQQGSVQSFRVFEIFVRLACVSREHLLNISEAKFNLSNKINNYLNDKSDILAILNCIELLTLLVATQHGYEYIEKTGHLNHLINYIINIDSDPYSELIIPSIVKFFARITVQRPVQVKEHFPRYYEFLFQSAFNENLARNLELINLSIETFSFMFEFNLVKKFIIENFSNDFSALLERLVWLIKNTINDKLKTNSIKALCELIAPDASLLDTDHTDLKWIESPWLTSEWIELSHFVYEKITMKFKHDNLFNLFLTIAKEPFAEKRLSAQLYFKSMAQTEWGLKLLFTPNNFNCEEIFLDGYLLNRSIELEKKGLESKLELIKLIVANFDLHKHLINIIGEHAYEPLRQYVREGAYFVRAQHEVAFENL